MASDLRCSIVKVGNCSRRLTNHDESALFGDAQSSFSQPGSCPTGELKLPGSDAVRANVRTQNFGDQHAAIRLLIVLDNGDPGATDGEAAAIQGVHQFALARAFRTITNVGTTGLEGFKVRARGNLAEQSLARQPHFDVVGFG